jgi:hypothetical protein
MVLIDSSRLVHRRQYFLGTLKGLIFAFDFKKLVSAFSAKKMWSLLCGVRYQKLRGALSHCAIFIGSDRRSRITWKLLCFCTYELANS